jgi:dihydrolipoamide dehydrogenase
MLEHMRAADKYGLICAGGDVNMPKLQARRTKIIRKLTAGIRARMTAAGVTVVNAEAAVSAYKPGEIPIEAAGETYTAAKLLLCTGSEVAVPPIPGLDKVQYWTSTEALSSAEIPQHLVVIGGGVVGMEFACFYRSIGSEVTVIEMLPEVLGGLDGEISAMFREECRKKGIRFFLSARVESLEEGAVSFSHEGEMRRVEADRVLLAAGRRPINRPSEVLPMEYDGRRLKVDSHMRTSLEGVYACGDITGFSMLAHTAEREAAVAVNDILGVADEMSYRAIPGVVYTSPEVAGVGMTEEQAKAAGIEYHVKKLPMSYAGRFVVENEAFAGLCKVIVDKEEKVLGVHMLGTPSSEIIVAAGMAVEQGLTASEWSKTVFPHPTVGEILKEALSE